MKASILLVDDEPGTIQLLGRILEGVGEVRFATSGRDALRVARDAPPDLILLDAQMPEMSGFEVCGMLKGDPQLAGIPVIFVTSHSEAAFEVAGFEIGAADFIVKPVNASIVRARVQMQLRLKRMTDELRRIATIDPLTGIANRRSFDDSLSREWRRVRRTGEAISLLMIDVDHFKAFNDRYGHLAGDACLRAIAGTLSIACPRPADLVARYGGEEFVAVLPDTRRAGAEHVVESVLESVRSLRIAHDASPSTRHVTVSIGATCFDMESACWSQNGSDARFLEDTLNVGCNPVDLLRAADQALYAAKRGGRARSCFLDISDVDAPERARVIAQAASDHGKALLQEPTKH